MGTRPAARPPRVARRCITAVSGGATIDAMDSSVSYRAQRRAPETLWAATISFAASVRSAGVVSAIAAKCRRGLSMRRSIPSYRLFARALAMACRASTSRASRSGASASSAPGRILILASTRLRSRGLTTRGGSRRGTTACRALARCGLAPRRATSLPLSLPQHRRPCTVPRLLPPSRPSGSREGPHPCATPCRTHRVLWQMACEVVPGAI